MKVILLHDVRGLGVKADIKNVSDGYAVNFLIPRGLVKQATKAAVAELETLKIKEAALEKVREDLLVKNLKKIKDMVIEVSEKANDKGHLFAAIHESEIALKLKESSGIDVGASYIKTSEPIKTVGEHEVRVMVKDKEASFKIKVNAAVEKEGEVKKGKKKQK